MHVQRSVLPTMSRLGTELASSVATSERPCLSRAVVALVRLYLFLFAVAAVDAVSFGASRPTATHHPVCSQRMCVLATLPSHDRARDSGL